MTLMFPTHEVTENGGPVVLAHIATCSCVEGESFRIFQVAGQSHFHIECIDCETSYCPFGACTIPARSPVFESGGEWFFWSEDGSDEHGPFPSEHDARQELARYVEWLNTPR